MKLLDILKDNFTPNEILAGKFGIEREGLRVRQDGTLTDTKHPAIFGPKSDNPYITTDFSESQVEVVTPPYESVHRAYEVLESLVDIVNNEIRESGELIWPASMPCIAPDDVPVAEYGEEFRDEYLYRLGLIGKYGGLKQLLTGIHFNFSFSDEFIDKLHELIDPDISLQDFKDKLYLKMARNYLRYRWLIIYLTGSSAAMHESYDCYKEELVTHEDKDTIIVKNGPSLRNSSCGYKNQVNLFPRYTSIDEYVEDVQDYVDSGVLQKAKELYTQIRLKTGKQGDILKSLKEDGVQYLEIRTIDLNVFDKAGVNIKDLEFLQLFMIYMMLLDEPDTPNEIWQEEALENENLVAVSGLLPGLELSKEGKKITVQKWGNEIIDGIEHMAKELGLGFRDVLYEMRARVDNPDITYANSMAKLVKRDGYIPAMMRFARHYSDDSNYYRYQMRGYEDYELSTQILIKEAITRGVEVEELDASDSFIALTGNGKTSLIKQATKTEADNYATVEAMGNKVVTKKLLAKKGIRVPEGREFRSLDDFKSAVSRYAGKPVVIKPKSTNYGLGIFIFENGGDTEDLIKAAQKAFEYDDTILLEEYLHGQEYRFLVIDGKTVAVLKRVPANVIGDGEHTIRELINLKNRHPFRGEGYTAPLKKIKVDEQTIIYLKNQGLTPEDIPAEGEQIFLRGNSNISTGGDSIDMTDVMPDHFKKLAQEAAQSVGATFCGVDLLIDDYENPESDYGIIELNFNPSTDMHAYPLEGKEHRTGAYIMSALGLIDEPLENIKPKEKVTERFEDIVISE